MGASVGERERASVRERESVRALLCGRSSAAEFITTLGRHFRCAARGVASDQIALVFVGLFWAEEERLGKVKDKL